MGGDVYTRILDEVRRLQMGPVDALSYYQTTQKVSAARKPDPLETAQDCDLIMELMKRGYAVWLPPVEDKK